MRDRLGVFGVLLALTLTVVALRYWLPDPVLTLEYLKVLVWPSLALFLLYAVRERLQDKLSGLIEWAGFGQLLKFTEVAVNARASQELSDASPVLDEAVGLPDSVSTVLTPGETPPSAPAEAASGETHDASPLAPAKRDHAGFGVRESERRAALTKYFTQGATWSWEMAKLGPSRPVPVIDWSEDGQPLIRLRGQSIKLELMVASKRAEQAQASLRAAQQRVAYARRLFEMAVESGDGSQERAEHQLRTAQQEADALQADAARAVESLRRALHRAD